MKLFRTLLVLATFPVLFFACKKEKSIEIGGNPGGAAAEWEFKESNILFKGAMDTAYYEISGPVESLTLEGTSSDGQADILLQIFGLDITAGTYKNPNVLFEYSVNGVLFYANDPIDTDKFTVTITSIDSVSVSGTFSGEVQDALGTNKTLTEGKFTAKFKKTSTGPPGNGQLILWSKQGCNGSGSILVKVQSQTGNITTFSTAAPSCGTSGSANFTLPAGSYAWKAFCNADSVQGVITVTAGNCTTAEVVFLVPGSICRISNMAFYDSANVADGAITSFYDANNQVNRIQIYDSVDNILENVFNLNYTSSQIRLDAQQYFDLEPGGRIREFHGYIDPSDDSTAKVVIKYTYDAAGYMLKSTIALDAAPNNPILTVDFVWTGGNLSKVTIRDVFSGERTESDYQYDLTRPAKTFISFFPNNEIFIFQSAINFGKNSTNIVTRSTVKDYDASNNVIYTETSDFTNYTFDANNYVKSFISRTDGSFDAKFVLSYKCF